MSCNSGSAANPAKTPDARTAGDPYAGRNCRVCTDMHVVSYLYLIVQFYAVLNDRVINRSPVYRGIGADFDIITDPDAAYLRHLDPVIPLHCNPETVGTNHGARMYDYPFSDGAIMIKRDIRVQHAAVTHSHASTHISPGADAAIGTDDGALLDDRMGRNVHTIAKNCSGVNDGARMSRCAHRRPWIEQRGNPGKIDIGIRGNNMRRID